ncbi:hypothetical protein CDV36_012391 [Fusarium kuroshium]|uniref:Uncharacterized protein n=1 Tax=Fusarium kuroshium TaxID=2010991 RepID=A0A3M2RRX1_9HYPO|nr:hypothetical protein CDV36_012391 [Fusarium kuroshium]
MKEGHELFWHEERNHREEDLMAQTSYTEHAEKHDDMTERTKLIGKLPTLASDSPTINSLARLLDRAEPQFWKISIRGALEA